MRKKIILLLTAIMLAVPIAVSFSVNEVSAENLAAEALPPHIHDMSVSCGGSGIEFEPWTTKQPAGTVYESSGNFYLTEDITFNYPILEIGAWDNVEELNLCLNGHTINGAIFKINKNAKLNLCDCKETGKIITFNGSDPYSVFYSGHSVYGEFNMYGGTLHGSGRADKHEHGVSILENGKFTMYAGTITRHDSEAAGGVRIIDNGVFIMNGGKITNNSAPQGAGINASGDNVYVIINDGEISKNTGGGISADGTVEINGGKIINNTNGSGLGCNGDLYISGAPIIKDNYYNSSTRADVSITKKLHISGSLDRSADIGIYSCYESYIFTANWNDTMGNEKPEDYFTSDSDRTVVRRYDDEAALCVLLTLDTTGIADITGDIPEPKYYPIYTDVVPFLPTNLERKGYIFNGWSELPNRQSGAVQLSLSGDTMLYPAFEVCKHGRQGLVPKVEPTCTETGFDKYVICRYCGMTFSPDSWSTPFTPQEIPALKHDFGDWETNENSHFRECARCYITENSPHSWNNGIITIEPTTEAEGEKTYSCTVCPATKTEAVPKLPLEETTAPTISETTPPTTEPPVSESGSSSNSEQTTSPAVTDPTTTGTTAPIGTTYRPSPTPPPVTAPPAPIVTMPPVSEETTVTAAAETTVTEEEIITDGEDVSAGALVSGDTENLCENSPLPIIVSVIIAAAVFVFRKKLLK